MEPAPAAECPKCQAMLKGARLEARDREGYFVSLQNTPAHPSHVTVSDGPSFVTGLLCPVGR